MGARNSYSAFVEELKSLCDKHSVTLSVSGYDSLQVWSRDPKDEALHCAGIEDRTGQRLQDNP